MKNNTHKIKFFQSISEGKYKNIILPVFLMLIIIFTILGMVYWLSKSMGATHKAIAYATQQETNIQDLKSGVYSIDLYTQELKTSLHNEASEKKRGEIIEHIRYELKLIQEVQNNINHAIKSFTYGGHKNDVYITALEEKRAIFDIKKAEEYWRPYDRLTNSFLKSLNSGAINSETIHFMSEYARTFSDDLYYQFEDISNILQKNVNKINLYLKLTIITGLLSVVLLFFYIIFIAIRQLLIKDIALELARQENADIMRTVKDGLFLVYPDYRISHEYSSELSAIIHQKNIGGRILHDLMETIISKKDLDMTDEFISQLFNPKVIEELINDLNPLDKIKVYLTGKKGIQEEHYLSFKFSRVYDEKKIVRVLVSVRDITKAVELEEKLEKERRQHDEELEMLASILHTNSNVLSDFIRHATKSTEHVNGILRDASNISGTENLRKKVEQIFRQIHSLKGEASALKLSNYVSLLQTFEKLLREIREKPNLTGNHFLPLVIYLEKLMKFNEQIDYLNSTLRQKAMSESDATTNKFDATVFFSRFAQDIAVRNNRKVALQCLGFEELPNLPLEMQDTIKDLIIQLLRNAVVHGIELPAQRQELGKTEEGHISIHLESNDDNHFLLTVQDDGRGIDYQGLRAKIVEMGKATEEEAEKMSHKELTKFMLHSGVSTMKEANEDAGQGVGSDIIVTNVRALRGRLGVFSQAGTFTRFSIHFPKK